MKVFLMGIFLCSQILSVTASECQKAFDYLNQRGEVYFRFGLKAKTNIDELENVIFIDKVEGREVYAYANKEGFQNFIPYDLPYEILIPPSLQGPDPEMSDYKNIGDKFVIDKYPTYEGYLNLMKKFAAEYPKLCKLHDLGETVRKRKIQALQLSKNVDKRECEPKFFHSSTIHGDETAGYMLTLRMANLLLSNYGKDKRVTNLLDSIELWICPLMNPDGTYKGGNNTVKGASRANANGKDLNRDYPAPPSSVYNQGPYDPRKAQVETQALMRFERAHNFVMSIDNHGGIAGAFYPWSIKSKATVDVNWFKLVGNKYCDLVKKNGGSFNNKNWNTGMYKSIGTRPDWQYRFTHCREMTMEISTKKTLSESNFNKFWNYHKDAQFYFYREMFNGIRGTITDSLTGKGLLAKVKIDKHDDDSSHVFSDVPHGNYYRPIIKGTYNVTFSCKDYVPKTITGVKVENGAGTIVNVKLLSTITAINKLSLSTHNTDISVRKNFKGITINCRNIEGNAKFEIYNINGTLMKELYSNHNYGAASITWDGLNKNNKPISNGFYVVKIHTGTRTFTQQFIVSR